MCRLQVWPMLVYQVLVATSKWTCIASWKDSQALSLGRAWNAVCLILLMLTEERDEGHAFSMGAERRRAKAKDNEREPHETHTRQAHCRLQVRRNACRWPDSNARSRPALG
jgi:hypothetical protein